jgi:hypothetical protein
MPFQHAEANRTVVGNVLLNEAFINKRCQPIKHRCIERRACARRRTHSFSRHERPAAAEHRKICK